VAGVAAGPRPALDPLEGEGAVGFDRGGDALAEPRKFVESVVRLGVPPVRDHLADLIDEAVEAEHDATAR